MRDPAYSLRLSDGRLVLEADRDPGSGKVEFKRSASEEAALNEYVIGDQAVVMPRVDPEARPISV